MPNILDAIQVSGASYDLKDKNAPSVSSLTQSEYDNLPSTAKTSNTFFVITDAQAGDLTNYYTKTETNTLLGGKADTATTYTKTEVDNAITGATSTKQDTLVSGTNIKTINNESILGSGNIDIQGGGGGGKAIEAGRGIAITTGETADTVSFNLPISAGTGIESLIIGKYNNEATGNRSFVGGHGGNGNQHNVASGEGSFAFGRTCSATSVNSTAFGGGCLSSGYGSFANGGYTTYGGGYVAAIGTSSHAEGNQTSATSYCSHSEGYQVLASNDYEHSQGYYNVSNKANTTWGDSGNTLFSVGNGTNIARHNAFEIRQNGDIYLSSGGTDIKLQDHLGGGGASYSAGTGIDITNDVISVTGKVDTTTYNTYTAATDTALSNKQTTLTAGTGISIIDNVISATGGGGGMTEDDELLLSTALVDLNERKIDTSEVKSQLGNYQKKGDYVTTNTLNTRLAEYETALDEQNVEEVTAYALNDLNERFGGLKIVKITESEYAALTTKDENTLYIVVADPS